ncbi:unnamed protein product [Mycena citricolor]|uniref:Uncharacterized protein n=1 Tax=Mycena citricolor TaxID=2018698 RepID=A0AAD2JX20_9AGAR|nr:unnamed protein product [Mycena citricolor]
MFAERKSGIAQDLFLISIGNRTASSSLIGGRTRVRGGVERDITGRKRARNRCRTLLRVTAIPDMLVGVGQTGSDSRRVKAIVPLDSIVCIALEN